MAKAPNLETLLLEMKGRVAWVRLNRPPANAVSRKVMDELFLVAEYLDSNKQCKAVVFASTNPRFFSAGADIGMVSESRGETKHVTMWQQAVNRIEAMSLPTIAAINGMALGAGWELSLVCDLRVIAREKGQIGLPEIKLGVFAAGGGTQRMTRLVGRGVALDILLTGRFLGAEEAYRLHMVNRVVDDDKLEAAVQELAEQLAAMPRPALVATKRCVIEGGELPLRQGLEMELKLLPEVSATPEAAEGLRAFLEKRAPKYD